MCFWRIPRKVGPYPVQSCLAKKSSVFLLGSLTAFRREDNILSLLDDLMSGFFPPWKVQMLLMDLGAQVSF